MSEPKQSITIETVVHAPIELVWDCWTNPEDIKQWNAASDDWHTPASTNDLRVGGEFHSTMAAKDGSASFDFWGTHTEVMPYSGIASVLGDGRELTVAFEEKGDGVHITETFDIEHENSAEMQRKGWQAILDSFKKYVENKQASV